MFNMMDIMRITWTMMTMQRMLMIFEGEQIVLLFSLNRRFLILTSTTSEPLRPPTITTESCCPLSKILSITILSPAMFKGTRSRKKRLSFSKHFPAGHHEGCKKTGFLLFMRLQNFLTRALSPFCAPVGWTVLLMPLMQHQNF